MNRSPTHLALLTAVALAGCRAMPLDTPRRETLTTLYFGLGLKNGGEVSEADFQDFVDREIVPRFPTGFTIQRAEGAWQQDDKTRREQSRVLTVLHPGGTDERAIDDLRAAYCRRFAQESVLRIDDRDVNSSFKTGTDGIVK